MAADDDQFVFSLDLKAKYLVDGFLLIQDLYADFAFNHKNSSEFF